MIFSRREDPKFWSKECYGQTDSWMDSQMDRLTDRPSYTDTRRHLTCLLCNQQMRPPLSALHLYPSHNYSKLLNLKNKFAVQPIDAPSHMHPTPPQSTIYIITDIERHSVAEKGCSWICLANLGPSLTHHNMTIYIGRKSTWSLRLVHQVCHPWPQSFTPGP